MYLATWNKYYINDEKRSYSTRSGDRSSEDEEVDDDSSDYEKELKCSNKQDEEELNRVAEENTT